MQILIDLTEEQAMKLQALAKARKRTEVQCVIDMIDAAQPGGSGWQHPMDTSKAKKS